MRIRKLTRRFVINSAAALQLDRAERVRARLSHPRGNRVRVFYLHGIAAMQAERFRHQISWLRKHFEVIDFGTFKRLFDGTAVLEDDRPAALLTFDDGFANNYHVAAPLLEEAGMRGVFFVVPQFAAARGPDARRFYRERVRDVLPPFFEPAMTPDQAADLSARGHTIGNHTWSHARLSEVPEADYHREIVESAAVIESWIGTAVEAFAWPFAWNAITPAAHRLVCQRHAYCFTPCSGQVNVRTDSRRLIWRTSIEPYYGRAEFLFQCSGLADYVAARRRRQLSRTLAAS
jgi:peptidoglycan/xylan/chitin deacetylase (PgdA/CDA1 family)